MVAVKHCKSILHVVPLAVAAIALVCFSLLSIGFLDSTSTTLLDQQQQRSSSTHNTLGGGRIALPGVPVQRQRRLLYLSSPTGSPYDVSGRYPENPAAACELYFLQSDACEIHSGRETMLQCLARYGCRAWGRALPPKCVTSAFWQRLVQDTSICTTETPPSASNWATLLDSVIQSTLVRPDETYLYLPPARRTFSTLDGPLMCAFGPIFRFGYFIPESNVAKRIFKKVWDWSPALPPVQPAAEAGEVAPYPRQSFMFEADDEFSYNSVTALSYFSWTIERHGVNCVRTMEVLSQGSVPYYPDYDRCQTCLSQLPRHLLERVLNFPGVSHIGRVPSFSTAFNANHPFFFRFHNKLNVKTEGTIDWTVFNIAAYEALAGEFLNFTRWHLTCAAGMASLLRFIEFEEPANVLHLIRPEEGLPGNNGVCGLTELGINFTRNVVGTEHRRTYPSSVGALNLTDGVSPNATTGTSYSESIFRYGINFLYGHGFTFVRRSDGPPNPPVDLTKGGNSDDNALCEGVLRGQRYDMIFFAGSVPSPDTIPCYHAAVRLLREEGAVLKKFVVLDVGDNSQAPVHNERIVRDGVILFAINEPRC